MEGDGVNSGAQTERGTTGEGRGEGRGDGRGAIGGGENLPDRERERRPLGGLSSSDNSSSRTISTSNTVRAGSSVSTSSTVRSTASSIVRTPSVPNATFQIFSDQRQAEENVHPVHPVLTENPHWNVLSTQATKKKENEGLDSTEVTVPLSTHPLYSIKSSYLLSSFNHQLFFLLICFT
jgi:hypothetical protein